MYKASRNPQDPDTWYLVPHQSVGYRSVKWALAAPFIAALVGYVVYAVWFF